MFSSRAAPSESSLRLPLRPTGAQRLLLHLSVTLLFVTGLAWLWVAWSYQPAWEAAGGEGGLEPYPLKAWAMRLHGLFAFLLLPVLGSLVYPHLLPAWRRQRNRITGATLALAMLLLVVSGYGLYYFSGEMLRNATSWLHEVVGVLLPLAVWLHVRRARRLAAS